MPVPVSQMWTVATYVIKQKLAGRKRYPFVLMLEPLFRCNLACAGCGKIQYPGHVLKKNMTPEQAFRAVEECGAPTVAIPGGEPLMHPQIHEIVNGLVARKKYIYLCTNALLLKQKLDLFTPSKYLTFSVHVDGEREHHDFSVCKEGGYDIAVEGIREAIRRGFRVTTNTTLFDGADPNSVRRFFDEMMEVGVEGMMLSPGYSYDKAPDQQHFLAKSRTRKLFRSILSNRKKTWKFNQSLLFLEFLMGHRDYSCTPWGMPTYNVFGWQKPCYLLQDGYAETFHELMASTEWHKYGTESDNPKCANCMVHSGYEASAVDHTFSSLGGIFAYVKAMVFSTYRDADALAALSEPVRPAHSPADLVQIQAGAPAQDEPDVVPGFEHEDLQGKVWEAASEEQLRLGLEKAFDYRGDVTITTRAGARIEGYVFDRQSGRTLQDSFVRVIPKDSDQKVAIAYADIAEPAFTGRDAAAGKSWEAWVKKYVEKKAAGEKNIELTPEKLD